MAGPRSFGTAFWWCDQVETLAVAIAMALVLKFFVIEAYQIPTGSMQPTMMGDAATGIQDRVLADKLCTMLRDPRRYEVMIFRFPWDERRLYVKRIVGLPGETLEIAGGDLWADGKIARKPDQVNDSVFKAIFPVHDEGMDVGRAFSAGAGVTVSGQRATFAPDATGELRLRETVRADYLHGYDPAWKDPAPARGGGPRDAGLGSRARRAGRLRPGRDRARPDLHLGRGRDRAAPDPRPGGGRRGAGRPQPAARRRRPGARARPAGRAGRRAPRRRHRAGQGPRRRPAIRALGGRRRVAAGGRRRLRPANRPPPQGARRAVPAGWRPGRRARRPARHLLPAGARDRQRRWEIPDDSYFAMGDNTQGSYDSRSWRMLEFDLRGPGDPGLRLRQPHGSRLQPAEAARRAAWSSPTCTATSSPSRRPSWSARPKTEPAPFIHRRFLLGKAVAVFWPIRPSAPSAGSSSAERPR
jgi:signal peptidase I